MGANYAKYIANHRILPAFNKCGWELYEGRNDDEFLLPILMTGPTRRVYPETVYFVFPKVKRWDLFDVVEASREKGFPSIELDRNIVSFCALGVDEKGVRLASYENIEVSCYKFLKSLDSLRNLND